MKALRIVEYLDSRGRSPFAGWFEGLDANAAAKITAALYQLGAGNWGNTKAVGGGMNERSTSAQVIGSILVRQERVLSFFLAEVQSNVSNKL